MATQHVVHPSLLSGRPSGTMFMTQAPTPVIAQRAPAVGHTPVLPVQSGPLPNVTGLPHGTPSHQFLMYGKTS